MYNTLLVEANVNITDLEKIAGDYIKVYKKYLNRYHISYEVSDIFFKAVLTFPFLKNVEEKKRHSFSIIFFMVTSFLNKGWKKIEGMIDEEKYPVAKEITNQLTDVVICWLGLAITYKLLSMGSLKEGIKLIGTSLRNSSTKYKAVLTAALVVKIASLIYVYMSVDKVKEIYADINSKKAEINAEFKKMILSSN